MTPARLVVRCLIGAASIALVTACSSESGESAGASPAGSGEPSVSAATAEVTLQEWSVVPATTSVSTGTVTFRITNEGPEDEHEFVVFRTDLDAGDLPTDDRGVVNEDGEGLELVDEVEELAVGSSDELTVDLEPGHYVLVCNIWSEDESEAHYRMGMRTNFEVQ